ncbi:MAG TPA: RDD family protein [Gemmatimonadaceae bacterium]|nr:RDD family protein [Gemmatimonadaceae bacterium]
MTQPSIVQNVDLASLPQRLAAQFLDGLVVAIPVCVLLFSAMALYGFSLWPAGVLAAAAIFYALTYILFCDGLAGGQSLGKRWVGIRVISSETGAPCTFRQSFVRNILLSFLGPIDWFFIFGDLRQRLGDKAAGTIVIVD